MKYCATIYELSRSLFTHSYVRLMFSSIFNSPPPSPTLFPYTTLFRSHHHHSAAWAHHRTNSAHHRGGRQQLQRRVHGDRKSTRLNSSHLGISYAVFCLKKKRRTHPILLAATLHTGCQRADGHRVE